MGTISAVVVVILVSLLFIAMATWPLVEESDARAPAPPPLRVVYRAGESQDRPRAA
jgi:hypothetical protein